MVLCSIQEGRGNLEKEGCERHITSVKSMWRGCTSLDCYNVTTFILITKRISKFMGISISVRLPNTVPSPFWSKFLITV